jgi:hypothetical protein
MAKKQTAVKNKPDDFADIVADADAHRAATANNVVPLKAKKAARQTRRPSTRVWDKNEVATRALDLYAFERTAESAYGRAIQRAEQFKEKNDIEGHVDHKDPAFRRYTAKQWNAYLEAKDEVKKAKARLTTACRNCLHDAPKRERINPKDLEAWKLLFAKIKAGTISMVDALAARDSKGDAFVKSRETFLDLQAPDDDSDSIPF